MQNRTSADSSCDQPCRLDPVSVASLIRGRRTIHLFEPGEVPSSLVEQAIELATWAPNHHHTEPWRFHLLGPETIHRVVELNTELVRQKKGDEAAESKRQRWSEVPGWLCVTCQRSADELRQREDFAACCCAIQNLALYLWSAGIGLKWTTGPVTRDPRFAEALRIDSAQESVVGLCWYGRAAQIPEQKRRPVAELLTHHP